MSEKSKLKSSLRHLRKMYVFIDEAMDKARDKYNPPCVMGCSYCCRQMVAASIPEAMIALSGIVENPSLSYSLRQKLSQLREEMNHILLPQVTVKSWFERDIPCIFLTPDNICSIYENRPVACRTQMVVEKDNTRCTGSGKIHTVDDTKMTQGGMAAGKAVADELGIFLGYGPFQGSVLWAWMVYSKGLDHFRNEVRDTPFASDVVMSTFWQKLELDEGISV